MSKALIKTFGMKNELICLSFTLLSTAACSPMSFSDATQSAALQQGISPISSGEVSGPAEVISSGEVAQTPVVTSPVVVTPVANPIIDDRPFEATISLPKCVDTTQDPLAFDLISGADSKVVSAQVTNLPNIKGEVYYQNYSIYAVYQADNELHGEQAHAEATVDQTRAYGYFNCNLQTIVIEDVTSAKKIQWMSAIPRTKLHVLMPDSSMKPVGIAFKNQHTQQVTLRCFK